MSSKDGVGANSEDARIEEEYKIWKKNAPFLYDVVITHALDWPSLTVQWLPVTTEVAGGDYVEHKLLLGTHVGADAAPSDRNYLMLATVRLPSEQAELKVTNYDEDRGELGGYASTLAKVEVSVRINHPTEVNKARHCPQDHFLVATKTAGPEVLLFDWSKHPTKPANDAVTPLLRLAGHESEGYGLAWSAVDRGKLLSGSDDGIVCAWDVAGAKAAAKGSSGGAGAAAGAGGAGVAPLFKFKPHGGAVVEDVAWHGTHPHLFATASDDKQLRVWDARSLAGAAGGGAGAAAPKPVLAADAHAGNAMCVAFNPTKDFLLATGGTDNVVRLWDTRRGAKPLHTMAGGHVSDVLGLAWCPFSEAHLASSGQDRRVVLWDTARIGEEQDPEDAEDGPPELMYMHGGHCDRISDFSWNEKAEWTFASVSDDNVLQIWQPSENILFGDDEEGEGEEDDEVEVVSAGAGPSKKARTAPPADDDLE